MASGFLVLFVYSGMLKWIPFFPVDPTILFGAGLVAVLVAEAVGGIRRLDRYVEFAVYSTVAFFSWYYFTAVYTISDEFWSYKMLTLGLSILAFLAPIICFKTERHFVYFDRALVAIGLVASAIVLGFYLTGNIEFLLRQGFDKEATKIPNYLMLGLAISVGILLCMARLSLVNMSIVAFGMAALLVLGARGPILFTMLMVIAGFVLYSPTQHLMKQSFLRNALIIAATLVAFFSWSGSGRTLQRFSAMLSDAGALTGGLRVSEFSIAADVIASAPVFGVGLGGYGLAAYGIDENTYPHNLFLEAFAEAGVLGLLLISLSVLMIAVVALTGQATRRKTTYVILVLFYLLNYNKSGGFIGARDLYLIFGILLAYTNLRSAQHCNAPPHLYATNCGSMLR
jgi:hypothetical protein